MPFVSIHPPLGTLTVVGRESVIPFRVYVTSDEDDRPKDVELWTNMGRDRQWRAVAMVHGDSSTECQSFLEDRGIECYSLSVDASALSAEFDYTVRWRPDKSAEWQWAGAFGENGRIRVTAGSSKDYRYWRSQLRDAFVAGDDAPIVAGDSWQVAADGVSCVFRQSVGEETRFGRLEGCLRFVAFVRKNPFWIIPLCGSGCNVRAVGQFDIFLILAQMQSGSCIALVPFIRDDQHSRAAVFRAGDNGALFVHPVLGGHQGIRVAASISSHPHEAVLSALARIRQPQSRSSSPAPTAISAPTPTHLDITTRLGYCTWNTFYTDVSHDLLLKTLSDVCSTSSMSGEPRPEWVLIDDGWQSVTEYSSQGRLVSHEANPKFPAQLQGTVTELSSLGVKRVGVWHALWGYWGGIDPHGPLAHDYALERFHRLPNSAVPVEADVWVISMQDVHAFYDQFYRWLRSQGITFVKVDCQASFESLDAGENGEAHLQQLIHTYYVAMETAALKHFGPSSVIYCMSQTPDLILATIQKPPQPRMVFRNSDDYFPDVRDSHGWHIYCNMANLLWSRALEPWFVMDWDMFKPGQAESRIHAVSRALSGGPVYITGSADEYSRQPLSEYVGATNNTYTLSPPVIHERCIFSDMSKCAGLLVGASAVAAADAVLVSVYNVSPHRVIEPLSLDIICREASRVSASVLAQPTDHGVLATSPRIAQVVVEHDMSPEDLYAVRQVSTGRTLITRIGAKWFDFSLPSLAVDLLTVVRMSMLRSASRSATLFAACLGDIQKANSAGVVERPVHSVIGRVHQGSPRAQPCWTIRVRLAEAPLANHARIAFALRACNSQWHELPLAIQSIRILGRELDPQEWRFGNGLLIVCPADSAGSADESSAECCCIAVHLSVEH